jgi:hypothetical protein
LYANWKMLQSQLLSRNPNWNCIEP